KARRVLRERGESGRRGGDASRRRPGLLRTTLGRRTARAHANLHPTNIGQKVEIIVEHFRANVTHLLDGHAKAMVVTDSRQAALRYKIETDKYLKQRGYAYQSFVAFSGKLSDEDYGIGWRPGSGVKDTGVGSASRRPSLRR